METIKLHVNLNLQQLVDAVKQLSPKDRLTLSDAIWNDETDIPVEHQKIVLDRMSKSKENPERLLDWEEVSKNL